MPGDHGHHPLVRADRALGGQLGQGGDGDAARRLGDRGRATVDALFTDIDVILTAPAPGEAPPSLATTGNAIFNLLWTYLWMPCITLPFTKGPNGLPIG